MRSSLDGLDAHTWVAPLLLAPLVLTAAWVGHVSPLAAAGFVVLLGAWGGALAFAKKRVEARARGEASRQELDAAVQRAVGMAETEEDLLDIASQAIAQVLPGSPAEILLASQNGTEIDLAAGVVHATTTAERPFATDQIVSLESIASHVGGRLRMLQLVSELQTQATTDSLTTLPNRRSFEERAERMLRGNTGVVAIADLDHFKKLNDTYGHAAGDRALKLFADSLRRSFPGKHDIVARLGGEEFALVLPLADVGELRAAFARAGADRAETLDRQGGARFTASFGIALAPEHGLTVSELLRAADRALYAAKANGRDRAMVAGDAQHQAVMPGDAVVRKISLRPAMVEAAAPEAERVRGAA